jgi:asparagine synthase (glutamine-hydrolysing)
MSAHAGLFYFDGRPVPSDALDTLAAACRPFGPDNSAHACPTPGVALSYHALRVTPEDEFERQPVRLADGRLLTWSGRLDDRDDFVAELGLPPSHTTPDSQIVAEACMRWNDDVFQRLIGDWSLALWNPRNQHVTIACDPFAVRALFYLVTDSYCAWSTALEGLVDLTGRSTDFDDEYLQARAISIFLPGRTPYRGISLLPGGHFVRFTRNGVQSPQQYWHLPTHTIRYQDRRDYATHLRMLFRQAVADRLRSSHPVRMELSGGWDSSAVVCMAARVAADSTDGALAPKLETFSYITPKDREADEERFMDAVLAHTGLPAHKIPFEHDDPPYFPAPVHLREVHPGLVAAYADAREAGVRVVMTGRFGDLTMGNFPVDVASIVWSIRLGRPLALFQALRSWSLASQRTAWQLLWMAITELLPERVEVAHLCRRYDRSESQEGGSVPIIDLAPSHSEAMNLVRPSIAAWVHWCRQEQRPHVSRKFLQGLAEGALGSRGTSRPDCTGLVLTHPYSDRRLIDYMSSIPWSIVCEPGRPRALMRDALGPIMPERVTRRFSKGRYQAYHARRVSVIASLMSDTRATPEVVARRYVSAEKLAQRLQELRAGSSSAWNALLSAGIVETWLAKALAAPAATPAYETKLERR